MCAAGHTFDVARSGYVNLLQPQDRRSTQAGDSRGAVDARATLERANIGGVLIDSIREQLGALALPADALLVDLGSGTGEMLGRLCADRSLSGIGIDLSAAAADFASRRLPSLTWVVANADRRLPLLDHSVDVVLSVHGRRNPSECARVLTTTGLLFVVLPAPDDLIELRAFVQGQRLERDRSDAMLTEHRPLFTVVDQRSVRESSELDRDGLLNLLRATYRGARLRTAEQVQALDRMKVTRRSEVFVLRPNRLSG